jgi:hypothetical protein
MASRTIFLFAGGWALLCIPAILIAEQIGSSQAPFHVTQLLATVVCFASSVTFLVCSRRTASRLENSLAAVAAIVSGVWLSFAGYVIFALEFSAMD